MNIRLIQTLFMPPPPPPPSPHCPYKRGFTIQLNPALRTPASYGHPVNTDTFFLMPPPPPSMSVQTGFDHTVKPCFTDTRLIRTTCSYGHFFLMAPPPLPLLQCPYKRGLTTQSNLALHTPA